MANHLLKKFRIALALSLVVLLSAVPALAGLTIVGSNGITASGADGISFTNTSGITASGADGVLAFLPNGITASGADGITASGADGITASGADGITASGADSTTITHADGITISGADGITISGADGNTYHPDSIVIRNGNGITISGADSVIATGTNGITASGADTRNIVHADGITISGADSTVTIDSEDSITATDADGVVFSISPNNITVTGVNGITISGADGITISGADAFTRTGANALAEALSAPLNSGIASVDPELVVLLNQLTDDSTVNAIIVYHRLTSDADIADLQNLGVMGGTRYRVLPMIAVTTTKANLMAISHLPAVRSIYSNRTFNWNLTPAARTLTGVERVRRDTELTNVNRGVSVTGRGVTVAVLDTGVDGTHADLAGRVVQNIKLADTQSLGAGFNYPVAAPSVPNTDQAYGHGTFVAGVIAGNGQQSGGKYSGVASGANILGLSAGDGTLLFILSGFDYLLANYNVFNVRVVNCSFSANTVFDVNDPVNIATKMLSDAGVNVVFSAGNTGPGPDSLNPYSVAPWVVGTGATDDQGRLANFSSRGEFGSPLFHPTIVAPGVNTVSLRPSTGVSVTSANGLGTNDASLSSSELPYYVTGSGTSFSAPHVAGVIALMLEVNPQLTPAQIRDILQRTATPMPPYYLHEAGSGMLNAQAAVLEAAFPSRRFGLGRGVGNQNQVTFVTDAPLVFSGTVTPGLPSETSINIPANALIASMQISWGGLLTPNNLSLAALDAQGIKQAESSAINLPGLTGRRQRVTVSQPVAGTWKAVVRNTLGSAGTTQTYLGILQINSARYAPMDDVSALSPTAIAEIYQNFRGFVMWPIGRRFRPTFSITRADLATAMLLGGRVAQYMPASSMYSDVRDKTTMLAVESAQAAPNGALFPTITTTTFLPDAPVDRLTAVVALVRAAGLRQQAESGTYTLTYTDAASIPVSLRGYVAIAVQNGLITTSGTGFDPAGTFTRLDLSHAMVRLATLATQ
ncbi:MAG TPA: S8 family serine peptidase [Pyrinomonadaceae bacterium]|jgi:serine protease AprX|nr:S8 family serine peptidase [Pyrinomonadaceae bacterium]